MFILDLMLPGIDGFDICRQVRDVKNTPIIMVSAKKDDIDKIRGLGLGADDYILKPFEPLEVVAKVKARLRRLNVGQNCKTDGMVSSGGLCLNTGECCLIKNGAEIPLSKTEYLILKMFMESPGRVFTKEQIYSAGWNDDYAVDDNAIRVMISKLREKTGAGYIETIRGLGYRLVREERK